MSTHALTILMDEQDRKIVVIYTHSDGYPEGHGVDLARLLVGQSTKGLSQDHKSYNGANDLAAAIVAGLKDGPGNTYLYATTDAWTDYTYTVRVVPYITIEIRDHNGKFFFGTPEVFLTKYDSQHNPITPDWDVDALVGTFA